MKNLLRIFLILTTVVAAAATTSAFGQKTFDVQDFSKDYYGKVYLSEPAEVFSPGWVAIYEKKTNRQLIKINSDALVRSTREEEDGKIKANVKEIPYGEQSMIIHEDYNFDGVKDFALMDGQNSCYGGPSFQIYLAGGGKAKNKFVLSKPFTKLAQDNCGMFEVDAKKKMISTMTKSGCCWHESAEYVVVNNRPKAVRIVEEDARMFPFIRITKETRNGNRKTLSTVRTVDFSEGERAKKLLSFKTKTGDEVVLFRGEAELSYAYINRKGNVDFAYPLDAKDDNPVFTLDSKENPTTISFTNKGVVYRLYVTGNEKIGVRTEGNGKSSDIAGDLSTLKGSLSKVAGENLPNVIVK